MIKLYKISNTENLNSLKKKVHVMITADFFFKTIKTRMEQHHILNNL